MKKLFSLIIAVAVFSSVSFAQELFQGKMNYSFKMMGENVEAMEAFLPTGADFTVGKDAMVFEIKGGMMEDMMGRMLISADGNTTILKDDEKTAYKLKIDKDDKKETPKPTITKEEEVITICGYKCQKYKVTTEMAGNTTTQYVWVTDKLAFPKMEGGMEGMGASSMRIEGLKGLPLKTMVDQGPFTVIMTAQSVEPGKIKKKSFRVPKNYEVEETTPEELFGGMGM